MMRWLLIAVVIVSPCVAGCPETGEAEDSAEHVEQGQEGEEHGEEEGEEHGEEGEAPVVTLNETQIANAGISTEPLLLRDLVGVIEAPGEVGFDPDRLARVASPVAGRVEEVQVTPGVAVEPGQVLAVLSSPELGRIKGDYLIAQAVLSLAEQNLEREEGLAEARISAGQELLHARADVMRGRAELEGVEETLRGLGMSSRQIRRLSPDRHASSTFELTSPIAGAVLERNTSVGEGVGVTDQLFVIGDTGRVWVRADILEGDVAAVQAGQRASIRTGAFAEPFHGTVTYVAPVMDEITRTVHARVEVDNPDLRLRPGMFAQVEIELSGTDAQVLAIPREAILRRGGETFAFVADAPDTFRRVEVTLGPAIGSQQVVSDGLEAGQTVVVTGAFFLQSEIEKAGFTAGHGH